LVHVPNKEQAETILMIMPMAHHFGTCQLHAPEAPLNQTAEGILKRPADNGVER
jgi:hypothetical protein